MSSYHAIATVTATIGEIVQDAVGLVPGAKAVIGRPAAPGSGAFAYVYLYGVSPDPAQHNNDLPSRNAAGQIVQRPQKALILHYLITFYGDELALEPQRMLAAVARDLHTRPLLPRPLIESIVSARAELSGSDLAESNEPIRLTPKAMQLEDVSRLWSVMLQIPYALSIAYDASPVLIDAVELAPVALPALRRGEEDRGPEAQAALLPRIESIWFGLPGAADLSPRPPSMPSAQLGAELIVAGANLGGESVRFEFKHPARPVVSIEPVAADPGGFRLALPDDAAAQTEWAAGLYAVTAVVTRDGEEKRSALWPMPLAPRIDGINPDTVPKAGPAAAIAVGCRPQVRKDQTARFLLANLDIAADDHSAADTATLGFTLNPASLDIKTHTLFLRVDGVDSQPFVPKPGGGFEFDSQQQVTVT